MQFKGSDNSKYHNNKEVCSALGLYNSLIAYW